MPHRRGLRQAGLVLLILVMVFVCLAAYFTRPRRLASLAGTLLHSLTGAQVEISEARIRWDGSIELTHVQMMLDEGPAASRQLFEVERMVIHHDVPELLRGRFVARSLTFVRPTFFLTEDLQTNLFNYQYLPRPQRLKDPDQVAERGNPNLPKNLPNIFIRDGVLELAETNHGSISVVGTSVFNGSFSADRGNSHLYYFALRQTPDDAGHLPQFKGFVDMDTLAVEATLTGFSFDDPKRNLLPRQLRDWWDRLAPSGELPTVQVGYDPDPDVGFFGVLEVSGASLTLPYTESKARMTVRSGHFKLTGRDIRITNLVGRIEGFDYTINGQVHGFGADAPFALTTHIVGEIPQKPRYTPWFPQKVSKAFEELAPTGLFGANVLVQRKVAGGPFTYEGSVDISQASVCYARFPYPLTRVRGALRFNEQQLRMINLRGDGPTGGRLVLNATLEDPVHFGPATISITGRHLPIDKYLLDAMAPKHRRMLEGLFDPTHYAKLTDPSTNILATPEQHKNWQQTYQANQRKLEAKPDEAEVKTLQAQQAVLALRLQQPVFKLGGVTNMQMRLEKPAGKNSKAVVHSEYDLAGVNLLLKHWAFPLPFVAGKFYLGPGGGGLVGGKIRGLTGGTAVVEGKMYWKYFGDRKRLIPDLKFTGSDFPVDQLALASLKPKTRKILSQLHVQGTIDAAGLIQGNDQGNPHITCQGHFREGSVRPFGGEYVIDGIDGYITIAGSQVSLSDMKGSHEQARFKFSGPVSGPDGMQLKLSGQSLKVEPKVLDLIPPHMPYRAWLEEQMKRLAVQGVFDVYWTQSSNEASTVIIEPRTASCIWRGNPIELTDMGGSIQVHDRMVRIRQCHGQYGSGKMISEGYINLDEKTPTLHLSFDAQNQKFCKMTRAMLPVAVLTAIDALKLEGGYKVRNAKFSWSPNATQGERLALQSKIHLDQATAVVGVDITELDGELMVDVKHIVGSQWPQMKMSLKADRLRAGGRMISPLSMVIANHSKYPDQLQIEQLSGICYEGLLEGAGQIDMADGGFEFRLTLENAKFEPITDPLGAEESTASQAVLSADLTVAGNPHSSEGRHGRGRIVIQNARMYELPLTMTMLQILNLSAPTARAFDQADVQFILDNDIVVFEKISFMSPSLNIIGTGTMRYSDTKLDLQMYTQNRNGPNLGPVSELFKVFKNELVTIHVAGTLEEPQATVKSLAGIKRSVREIIGKPIKK